MAEDNLFSGKARVIYNEAEQREEINIVIEPQLRQAAFYPSDMVRGGRAEWDPATRRRHCIVEALRPIAREAYLMVLAQGIMAANRDIILPRAILAAREMIDIGDELYREKMAAAMEKKDAEVARLTTANNDLASRLDELRRVTATRAFVIDPDAIDTETVSGRVKVPRDPPSYHEQLVATDALYAEAGQFLNARGTTMIARNEKDRDRIVRLAARRRGNRMYAQEEADGRWSIYRDGGFVFGPYTDEEQAELAIHQHELEED